MIHAPRGRRTPGTWRLGGATLPLAVFAALAPAASAQTGVTATLTFDASNGYFDNSSAFFTFDVTAADLAGGDAVDDVQIALDFEKYDGEGYGVNGGGTPYYNDIRFTLTGPNGQTVDLIAPSSFTSGADGFRGVINFSGDAAQAVNFDTGGPHAGTYRPVGPGSLADLNSADGAGQYTLFVQDTTGNDHLGLHGASLSLNGGGPVAAEAPEPSTAAAFASTGLGAAGLILKARKRRG